MISAVIHTYNEEKNIDRCLSSLSWVDEKIVIDMGSTDKTVEIAKSNGAKIYLHPFTNFVEPARNFGISKVQGDWVFIIDADEEIPARLSTFLKKSSQIDTYDYYRIPRKNIIFGKWIKHAGWWPDYQIRFFRKGYVKWIEKVHAIPTTIGSGTDIEPEEHLSIIHHNYQTIDQYVSRMNRYTSIAAKELYLDNKNFEIKSLFEAQVKEFVSRFFVLEGYKDGLHGLALSFLQSFSELVTRLKLWELEGSKHLQIPIKDIKSYSTIEIHQKQYWLTDKLVQENYPIIQKLWWKIKRKLHIYD